MYGNFLLFRINDFQCVIDARQHMWKDCILFDGKLVKSNTFITVHIYMSGKCSFGGNLELREGG